MLVIKSHYTLRRCARFVFTSVTSFVHVTVLFFCWAWLCLSLWLDCFGTRPITGWSAMRYLLTLSETLKTTDGFSPSWVHRGHDRIDGIEQDVTISITIILLLLLIIVIVLVVVLLLLLCHCYYYYCSITTTTAFTTTSFHIFQKWWQAHGFYYPFSGI